MFKNSGGKLKGLAKFIFVLIIVLASISAAVLIINAILMFTNYNNPAQGGILIASAALTVLIGIVAAWLSSISTYAAGQLVEDNQKIREILEYRMLGKPAASPESYDYFSEDMQQQTPEIIPTMPMPVSDDSFNSEASSDTIEKTEKTSVKESEGLQAEENTSEIEELVEKPEDKNVFPDGWECSSCGSRNSNLVNTCMSCGEKKGEGHRHGCPNCGTIARPGEMFCRNCGTKL